ncbi:MAG: FHA domain-containing protein [Lachnospiraceae bacterium]|nr:FHA domain-containing protein [Lachnospiraceae bacterium]
MISTEYIRNCNCNYERLALEKKPEEKRYQYCILGRGGIRYLLPCSLRYLNNDAYLYYDITSMQNLKQLFAEKKITRDWMKDFLWGMKQMRRELDRFLLEEQNIIWTPEHIYQDLEKNDFSFLFVPYYEGESGLVELMDFLVERIDYADEALVEFLYNAYEQVRTIGIEYVDGQMYEELMKLEEQEVEKKHSPALSISASVEDASVVATGETPSADTEKEPDKRGIRFLWEGRKKKHAQKVEYRESLRQRMNEGPLYAVCEKKPYGEEEVVEEVISEEEFGKTIYIEETTTPQKPAIYRLDGELVAEIEKFPFVIGKRKENADLVLNDYSASRVHARIVMEEGICYIEDLNSTNGTFKNGLRMQPYEKRKLESGDELKFGKTEYIYR